MTTYTKVSNNYIAENLSLENLPNEIWKPIKGYENLYHVSNYGRVRSLEKTIIYSNGNRCNYKAKILKQDIVKGYLRITMSLNNITERISTHRLVAIHFLLNPENKKCVNHIDGNKKNNMVSNLEWNTYSENENHSYNILNKINHQRKLTNEDVNDIKNNAKKAAHPFQKNKGNISYYMEKYNVSRNVILNILNKKYYVL